MKDILLVGIGGFAGSALRYAVSMAMFSFASSSVIPWGTLTVNFAGSMLIGILFAIGVPGLWPQLLIAGFCGGFTTFSAFSLEVFAAMRSGNIGSALLYILLSIVLCVAATAVGYHLGLKLK